MNHGRKKQRPHSFRSPRESLWYRPRLQVGPTRPATGNGVANARANIRLSEGASTHVEGNEVHASREHGIAISSGCCSLVEVHWWLASSQIVVQLRGNAESITHAPEGLAQHLEV